MDFPKKYKSEEAEERWQAVWEASQVYAWDPAKGREDTFSVDTPPPTVSGMKTDSAVRVTMSRRMPRSSWLAVMSRKHSSSASAAS